MPRGTLLILSLMLLSAAPGPSSRGHSATFGPYHLKTIQLPELRCHEIEPDLASSWTSYLRPDRQDGAEGHRYIASGTTP
jgi:hypothetical protein